MLWTHLRRVAAAAASLQRLLTAKASVQLRAQANAPAACHWLRPVLDDS